MLYNFTLGRWEEKTSISGTNNSGFGNTGWSMYETHHMMDQAKTCPALPDIRAAELKLYIASMWSKLTSSNSLNTLGPNGLCWTNSIYTFKLGPKLDYWIARTQLQ